MGLCGSIPLIMKERGVSYEGLSLFSLVSIPFSLKLLWAPLVDSCYFKRLGRRKTWIIPVQLLTGYVFVFLCICMFVCICTYICLCISM
jgi:PAT family acetyl-CoA transporter-like MFS transporter 1